MKLINFLINNNDLIQADIENLENFSCQTGGKISFINFLENNIWYPVPEDKEHIALTIMKTINPSFFNTGRINGNYCQYCNELVVSPDIIKNDGLYLEEEGLSLDVWPLNTDWLELLRQEIIVFDDNNKTLLNKKIQNNFAIVVPNGTSIAPNGFFEQDNLLSISLPNTLLFLEKNSFYNCYRLTDIYFRGTIEQWNTILKDPHWNENTGDYLVHCTNGVIAKESLFDWEEFITAIHYYENNVHTFSISLDYSSNTPSIVGCNCKFIENFKYGDTI